MPKDVQVIAGVALKDKYSVVDCVGQEKNTHNEVPQQYTVCTMEDMIGELHEMLMETLDKHTEDYKVVVFFGTARQTQSV
jgi:superfamily II DNA/RNA helicase